ncbi:NACHT domain-containing protein, partial [candidate division KSB1 bacterium]|nr:NACHT domain-containing protein [candidate division KSB1 bacterium]
MIERQLTNCIVKILPCKESEQAEGTGFWAAGGGYILTCTHVIKKMNTLWIAWKGQKRSVEVVDRVGDIALLRAEDLSGSILPLDSQWRVGDEIFSQGYQYDKKQGLGSYPIGGIITGPTELDGMEAIALKDADHVKYGASGSPVLNLRSGKVVGIISDKGPGERNAIVLALNQVTEKWDFLNPTFNRVNYGQEYIFDYYTTFVGRDEEIKAVRKFIRNKKGDYLLIQGGAGMGKTALMAELARKAAKVEFGKELYCLVFFIRQEEQRNTPEKFLDALNAQLLQLLEEQQEIPFTLAEKTRQYEVLWDKVHSRLSANNRLLVLIDGMDESAQSGEQPLLDFLPEKLPDFACWILTSRPLPDALDTVPMTHVLRRAQPM